MKMKSIAAIKLQKENLTIEYELINSLEEIDNLKRVEIASELHGQGAQIEENTEKIESLETADVEQDAKIEKIHKINEEQDRYLEELKNRDITIEQLVKENSDLIQKVTDQINTINEEKMNKKIGYLTSVIAVVSLIMSICQLMF